MPAYPYLVNVAWDVINKLLEEWQNNPNYYQRESDFHCELASRLRRIYEILGYDKLDNNEFSRISCEPYVSYKYKDDKIYRCHPDIVIWDNIDTSNIEPRLSTDNNLPILLACEIKYGVSNPGKWDLEKLEYLVDQSIIKFGCWLTIQAENAKKGDGIDWKNYRPGYRLWVCSAKLPAN